ncbi:proline--tRNA ligase [Desulfomonile tiedjei]|uniref:Proline--tRNA ligase n=1 Tax=Desulfomonile tiedjei (strain ATCC 49306 / DSM 6799 / DCB-1) TaxID=706587 RepID=I4CDH6_DESTA|nr:proline--tRNA ligase [Desulfomonile tiedjei]AFM27617.1 prolyl-tRNA synthetase [Desulfomonile tiedjei DSM 6799]
MRMSQLFVPTLKEDPADAEVISHRLMLRAGMIRKLTAGIYSYLPLGYRSLRKLEQIVREEMDAAGAQEVFLPMVQPAELWIESGRWNLYGTELLRFSDRHKREFCLGPTHEEVITDLVRRDVRSYRDLPLNLYQIQTKFRDEIRPRFGLMRGREFMMKDGYSFDATEQGAEESYRRMQEAYSRIFSRCGLRFRAVEADSGPIGGSFSHEFMVLADTGEDTVVSCDSCQYAANMEKAEVRPCEPVTPAVKGSLTKVSTPGMRTIEEVSQFLKVRPEELIKTLILKTEKSVVAVLIRGDHELNDVKVKNFLNVAELELADERTIQEVTGGPLGFSGPVNLRGITILADNDIRCMGSAVVGANEKDAHLINVNPQADFHVDNFGDFRAAQAGDACPRCDGTLVLSRGIEVGHVFKLGTKYSDAMAATFLDADGKERPMIMGCYGIGVSRTVAAAIEQNHDENGIIFPPPIAPFTVLITPVGAKSSDIESAAEQVYQALWENGIDVLLDDRDERPGVKFKDADLMGIPFRVTIGKKALGERKVELKNRRTGDVTLVALEEIVDAVKRGLMSWSEEN